MAALFLSCGCVERTLTITSTPPGALVYLNDREIGRTPVTHDFLWYGDYDLTLREEGYQALKTHQLIVAPIYEWVPFDLVSELTPFQFKDQQKFSYNLSPLPPVNPQALLERAEQLRADTRPTRRTATMPATQPAAR